MTPPNSDFTLYIGTYTQGGKGGIYGVRFNAQTGEFSSIQLLAATPNPSFLALAPDGRTLYAVNEWGQVAGENKGGLSAFHVEGQRNGEAPHHLVPLASVAVSGGLCHLTTDASGKWLLAAAYGDGSVSVWPILADGRLGPLASRQQHSGRGPNEARQSAPHAHHVVLSPDNRRVFVVDLGLDQVRLYDFDSQTGRLSPAVPPFVSVAAGAGPRHMALAPSGRYLYAVSELNNTITVFGDALGTPRPIQTVSTLPPDFKGDTFTAEIAVRPDGRFLYASNRGHNSIACYAIHDDGQLELKGEIATGRNPRHFTFDPSGKWLLVGNQSDHSVTVFRVDAQSGVLTPQSQLTDLLDEPVCLLFGHD